MILYDPIYAIPYYTIPDDTTPYYTKQYHATLKLVVIVVIVVVLEMLLVVQTYALEIILPRYAHLTRLKSLFFQLRAEVMRQLATDNEELEQKIAFMEEELLQARNKIQATEQNCQAELEASAELVLLLFL